MTIDNQGVKKLYVLFYIYLKHKDFIIKQMV